MFLDDEFEPNTGQYTDDEPPVWLSEERVYGYLISLGAFASLIRYEQDDVEYETYIENDEWEYLFDYEQE